MVPAHSSLLSDQAHVAEASCHPFRMLPSLRCSPGGSASSPGCSAGPAPQPPFWQASHSASSPPESHLCRARLLGLLPQGPVVLKRPRASLCRDSNSSLCLLLVGIRRWDRAGAEPLGPQSR